MLALLTMCSPAVRSDARTDGTAGRVQSLSGQFTVPQSLGTLAGGNLFHSFQSFSVNTGESATFTTSTVLQNVIARVTGGTPSTINGPLRLNAAGGGNPSLFLINPSGITLGAGSSVDVPGALHLSTANYLKLADGSVYQTDLAKGSSFSAAAPEAFGFLGATSGSIVLQQQAGLRFLAGQSLSLTAGDIGISDTTVISLGGKVAIAAVGTAAIEVGLNGAPSTPTPLTGRLTVVNGALVAVVNTKPADTGEVTVAAGDIVIGSVGSDAGAGIASVATAAGSGGSLRLTASNSLSLINGGVLGSSTDQAGPAGSLQINVGGKLQIGSRSSIDSATTGSGSAGNVKVAVAGAIALDGGGTAEGAGIGSETGGPGASGSVTVSAGAGLSVVNGARISSSSFGTGPAGLVRVDAASITLDNQGAPLATGTAIASQGGAGKAGSLEINTPGALTIVNQSRLSSSTTGAGAAGSVTVNAGSILLDARGTQGGTGIVSETSGAGDAGTINIVAQADVTIRAGARISSSSFLSGNAGGVTLRSGSLTIQDGTGGANASGIFSIAWQSGNAGTVDVTVREQLAITDGVISTSTEGSGKGGAISIGAGSISIGNTGSNGGGGITSNTSGTGNAGSVSVLASQSLAITNGATISSSTFAQGSAGAVTVNAGSILLNGQGSAFDTSIVSETYGTGNAGSVDVLTQGSLVVLNQGTISSSAFAAGNGGLVRVRAGSIAIDKLDGVRRTGIGSVAFSGTGKGGSVDVAATGLLSIQNGGEISSNTSTAGSAGAVQVSAQTIALATGASINSGATAGSSGQTGSVSIAATERVTLTGSRFSIENNATVNQPGLLAPGKLLVTAPRIELVNSEITASASGNIGAGNLEIVESALLSARDRSVINTSAVSGKGGSVVLRGGGVLLLDHSRLTTSITGTTNGDGGPISIDAPLIVLNAGFIQANTAVSNARGGDVSINVTAPGILIASGQQLISGGQPRAYDAAIDGPNVIQAARPDGVNGELRIASPRVDLSASLAVLASPRLDFGTLGADLCRIGDGSSLTPVGRGGLKPSVAERVRPSM
jgi:filamentous hemagglutinin family protein